MCSECAAKGWAAVLSNIEVTSCHSAVEPASISKALKDQADTVVVWSKVSDTEGFFGRSFALRAPLYGALASSSGSTVCTPQIRY